MLGDYRGKYTLWRGEDQWCQALKFGSTSKSFVLGPRALPEKNTGLAQHPAHIPSAAICWRSHLENTIGHHQGGCQQHNISGALSRGSTETKGKFFCDWCIGWLQRTFVPFPDGCNIGACPIDLHVRGLEALGAQVETR